MGLGHTRIAHIAGPDDTSTGRTRARAFRHAVRDRGLSGDAAPCARAARWSEDEGARALRGLLDTDAGVTAIVAGNDLIALGCYDVLAERGIACPEGMSVVGFNNMPFLGKLSPPLTTVAIPHHDIGAEAARILVEQLDGSPRPGAPAGRPRSVLLPVELTERGSTGPAPPPSAA